MRYHLIDDPLCDVEGFDSYENCEECPYFCDCMEVEEECFEPGRPEIDIIALNP